MIHFDIFSIVGTVLLFTLVMYQLYFYFSYLLKFREKPKAEKSQYNYRGKISVIISCENDAFRLRDNLSAILQQDYPDFEVILVNNGSTDETDLLIEDLSREYTNIYSTFIPTSADKAFNRKKLALTIGAKAAKGDFLLFVEPYSIPKSNHWISSIANSIKNDDIEVVLGISNVKSSKSFLNRIARYNNLFFSMEYISEAMKNKPFIGTFRNLALKKATFFDHKGFANSLMIPNSEDLYLNQIVNEKNTVVCLDIEGTTISDYSNYKLWRRIMKNYSLARSFFKNDCIHIFSIEKMVRVMIYVLSLLLIIYAFVNKTYIILGLSIFLFGLKLFFNYYVISKSSKLFDNGKFRFSLPIVDLIEALYCVKFRTRKI